MKSIGCQHCAHSLCISKVSVFKQLSHAQLTTILEKVIHIDVTKGDTFIREGDHSSTLYIINSGTAKLVRSSSLGKEQIIALQTDGDIIGEYYLLTDFEPYNFSAIALTDMKLCTLSKVSMDSILDLHPSLCRSMLTELSKKMIDIENKLQNITITYTDGKVAYMLLQLHDKFGASDADGSIINNPLSREEMANFTGMTRETMSRYLNKLAKDGVIQLLDGRLIQLLDISYLKSML